MTVPRRSFLAACAGLLAPLTAAAARREHTGANAINECARRLRAAGWTDIYGRLVGYGSIGEMNRSESEMRTRFVIESPTECWIEHVRQDGSVDDGGM
jgi:hypothetical protein